MNRTATPPAWKPGPVSTGDPTLPPGPPPASGPAPGGWTPGPMSGPMPGAAPGPAPRRPVLSSGAVVALTILATFGALATVGFAFMGLFLAFGADSCTSDRGSSCGDTIGVAILGNIIAQGVLFLVAVVTPWIRPIRPGWRIAIVAAVIPLALGALVLAFVVAAASVPSTT